jgi:para-aminobenzoate synthetase
MLRSGGSVAEVSVAHDKLDYLSMIEEAQKHIAAGDVYQICLTNQIRMTHNLDALNVFMKLRASNPAPYAAYLRIGNLELVSTSPEMFLRVESTGLLSTMPIKGTRPRDEDPSLDAAAANELGQNLKERAENLMIVDLMRNDLGRVSEPGSVSVPKLFEVQSYATVHQLVSTVESKLAPNQTAASALQAAFPGGSMTGAPKIRAMQIIDDLEGCSRGAYSGAIGYFGFDGSAEFAMTIRSMVFEGDRLSIGVGGGITSDSEPEAEFEEIRLKARALLEALDAPDPWANR